MATRGRRAGDRAGHRADRTPELGRVMRSVEGARAGAGFDDHGREACRRDQPIPRSRNLQRVGGKPHGSSVITRAQPHDRGQRGLVAYRVEPVGTACQEARW